MLAADHRLRESDAFRRTVRSGRRAGSASLVAHLYTDEDAGKDDGDDDGESPPVPVRVGLVVSKAVGGAVVRTGVKRRLRHLVRERLDALPPGSTLVLRALPASAGRSSAELARDLDRCLERVVPAPGRPAGTGASS